MNCIVSTSILRSRKDRKRLRNWNRRFPAVMKNLYQQIVAGRETGHIRKEGEAIRQEISELSATNHLLKEQTEMLTENKEKLLSKNEKLEKQQKKLQQEINKIVQSKEVIFL